jgi:proline iminopeptidase
MRRGLALAAVMVSVIGCSGRPAAPAPPVPSSGYLDDNGRSDRLGGGARMIPIRTPKGEFRVWTKRVGNNPRIKVLLLHGGPAATHEYFEACHQDAYFPPVPDAYFPPSSHEARSARRGTCRSRSLRLA